MMHTLVLLGTLTAILLAVGWVLGGVLGIGLALVLAIVLNFTSYWYSDRIVLRMYKARPLDNKEIEEAAARLAREAKIPKPRLYQVPTDIPNAFATGRDPQHAVIAVTAGLLNLDKAEIEGVLAHEMAHIRNRDVLVSTMAATIGGAIAFMAQIGYWSLFGATGRRGEGNLMGLILIIIFAPLAAFLVRMAISRKREYGADRFGAVISKRPGALASALRRISERVGMQPLRGNSATSHMWIVNPFHKDWFTHLFASHPPLEKRISRLETMEAKLKED
ncbi:MAG: M48 family metalloprotease [Candidatus Aenigmatarchaeota archaeon]